MCRVCDVCVEEINNNIIKKIWEREEKQISCLPAILGWSIIKVNDLRSENTYSFGSHFQDLSQSFALYVLWTSHWYYHSHPRHSTTLCKFLPSLWPVSITPFSPMPDFAISRDLKFTSSALRFLTASLATEPSALFSPKTKRELMINSH